jgi:hypothetical protein
MSGSALARQPGAENKESDVGGQVGRAEIERKGIFLSPPIDTLKTAAPVSHTHPRSTVSTSHCPSTDDKQRESPRGFTLSSPHAELS